MDTLKDITESVRAIFGLDITDKNKQNFRLLMPNGEGIVELINPDRARKLAIEWAKKLNDPGLSALIAWKYSESVGLSIYPKRSMRCEYLSSIFSI